MKITKQILPGIQEIGWLDCRNLPNRVALDGICNNKIAVLTDIHKVTDFGEASCECSTKKEGTSSQDTTILKFRSGDNIIDTGFLAFVIQDVNGRKFLIGSKEPPFVKVERSIFTGLPSGNSAGYEYEITHKSIKSMIECEYVTTKYIFP